MRFVRGEIKRGILTVVHRPRYLLRYICCDRIISVERPGRNFCSARRSWPFTGTGPAIADMLRKNKSSACNNTIIAWLISLDKRYEHRWTA